MADPEIGAAGGHVRNVKMEIRDLAFRRKMLTFVIRKGGGLHPKASSLFYSPEIGETARRVKIFTRRVEKTSPGVGKTTRRAKKFTRQVDETSPEVERTNRRAKKFTRRSVFQFGTFLPRKS